MAPAAVCWSEKMHIIGLCIRPEKCRPEGRTRPSSCMWRVDGSPSPLPYAFFAIGMASWHHGKAVSIRTVRTSTFSGNKRQLIKRRRERNGRPTQKKGHKQDTGGVQWRQLLRTKIQRDNLLLLASIGEDSILSVFFPGVSLFFTSEK